MMLAVLPVISLLLVRSTFANPFHKFASCSLSKAVMSVPASQTTIVAPTTTPSFVAIGVGVQNYSCSSTTSTYTSTGAVAELYNIACLVHTPQLATIANEAYALWSKVPGNNAAEIPKCLEGLNFLKLGAHYFITNPVTGTGLSPKWDFTSTGSNAGDENAFVVAAKAGDLPAPTGPGDVDWLSLTKVQGDLATQVFRVATVKGQPPASCTPGSAPISVKYTAQYWLYGAASDIRTT